MTQNTIHYIKLTYFMSILFFTRNHSKSPCIVKLIHVQIDFSYVSLKHIEKYLFLHYKQFLGTIHLKSAFN